MADRVRARYEGALFYDTAEAAARAWSIYEDEVLYKALEHDGSRIRVCATVELDPFEADPTEELSRLCESACAGAILEERGDANGSVRTFVAQGRPPGRPYDGEVESILHGIWGLADGEAERDRVRPRHLPELARAYAALPDLERKAALLWAVQDQPTDSCLDAAFRDFAVEAKDETDERACLVRIMALAQLEGHLEERWRYIRYLEGREGELEAAIDRALRGESDPVWNRLGPALPAEPELQQPYAALARALRDRGIELPRPAGSTYSFAFDNGLTAEISPEPGTQWLCLATWDAEGRRNEDVIAAAETVAHMLARRAQEPAARANATDLARSQSMTRVMWWASVAVFALVILWLILR